MSNNELISLLEIKNMSNHEVQKLIFNSRHSYRTIASGKKKLKEVLQRQRLPLGNSSKNPSICPKAAKNIAFILYAQKNLQNRQKNFLKLINTQLLYYMHSKTCRIDSKTQAAYLQTCEFVFKNYFNIGNDKKSVQVKLNPTIRRNHNYDPKIHFTISNCNILKP